MLRQRLTLEVDKVEGYLHDVFRFSGVAPPYQEVRLYRDRILEDITYADEFGSYWFHWPAVAVDKWLFHTRSAGLVSPALEITVKAPPPPPVIPWELVGLGLLALAGLAGLGVALLVRRS